MSLTEKEQVYADRCLDLSVSVLVAQIEFWAAKRKYNFSFQFWGKNDNNVFIYKDFVEIACFGGESTAKKIMERVVAWCEKANPSIKYPQKEIEVV